MQKQINIAKNLLISGKVKKVGENGSMGQLYDVDDQTVRIYSKPGRKLMSCTCENFTMFCSQPRICHHIVAAILLESHFEFYNKIDEIINFYQNSGKYDDKIELGIIISHLQDLKRIK